MTEIEQQRKIRHRLVVVRHAQEVIGSVILACAAAPTAAMHKIIRVAVSAPSACGTRSSLSPYRVGHAGSPSSRPLRSRSGRRPAPVWCRRPIDRVAHPDVLEDVGPCCDATLTPGGEGSPTRRCPRHHRSTA